MAAKKKAITPTTEEITIKLELGNKQAEVMVTINNQSGNKVKKIVPLVLVNGEMVPDHKDTNPGVFSSN